MSLLSNLLNHMPPNAAGTDRPIMAQGGKKGSHLALVQPPAQPPQSPHTYAARATPEWRKARDLYLNHIMVCRGCYAPTGRHCATGAHLRASYEATPMEAHQ